MDDGFSVVAWCLVPLQGGPCCGAVPAAGRSLLRDQAPDISPG
ncbi:hypothetical protein [Pseudarthrobacter phenanthrenivorans]|nr:hypothetical protein [Pseudarthrobacter phenanthrenivorans]